MQYYQGDVCFEPVTDGRVAGRPVPPAADGGFVVALGELTGHKHAVYGADVEHFQSDTVPSANGADLIIGHIRIGPAGAVLRHEEHAPVTLPPGLYRVRRQREYDDRREARFGSSRLVAD